ncbi:bacillithiol biosynthesis cysteine-adding enzyme BshC [Pedobacter sp. MC2016-14]|uniref:bacillithiol biosynthesis cysteine-adding enzyme BshC n=1 Tax=Pedobacter sp. MC2016-14 TaxID=2897327 RepID=UPI001E647240|nr:bacillithiol biosynthesis cysteine-adding enzyme BshC [Pedobacter sp. MC2016-14]MCD0488139.1 bacillithiol biosynthesis cysteine-adding enzyme BshC [Pedobacter sp. MC2016-14]
MQAKHITYQQTGAFSSIILDYIAGNEQLSPFYAYSTNIEGFKQAISNRKVLTNRQLLVKTIQQQYKDIPSTTLVQTNISLLEDERTFTITTGHQLNIFTGPLYFIYKIVTAINLARDLKKQFPEYNFVPVYWMATEDHDFEEINHVKIEDKMLTWNTQASGATGKLSTKDFNEVLLAYKGYLGISKNGVRLSKLIESAYINHDNLADATREMVDGLFAEHGLVCIDADDKGLKAQFAPYIYRDITEQNSFNLINTSNHALEAIGYKAQVNPREINFFYMKEGLRERITEQDGLYQVLHTDITFTKDQLKEEIETYPERFSPNVVMRPLYQEIILPNLAYIGGGAEVTYWLQLKSNFDHYQIDYPVLILRNSALVIDQRSQHRMEILGISHQHLFNDNELLKNNWIKAHVNTYITLSDEERAVRAVFDQIKLNAYKIDKTLSQSVDAAKTKTLALLASLDKKMLRAEKRKHSTSLAQIENLKNKLFPSGVLQERVLNLAPMYVLYGDEFIDSLIDSFDPLAFQFTVIFA